MGDPAGAAAHVRQSLKPDGTWMIVEPHGRKLADRDGDSGAKGYQRILRCLAATMICRCPSR
jgi:hypothetical protein